MTHSQAISHIGRVKSLSIPSWDSSLTRFPLETLVHSFSRPVPLLERLEINLVFSRTPPFRRTLFDGDLSLLRELKMAGFFAPLPWESMGNLVIFDLSNIYGDDTPWLASWTSLRLPLVSTTFDSKTRFLTPPIPLPEG